MTLRHRTLRPASLPLAELALWNRRRQDPARQLGSVAGRYARWGLTRRPPVVPVANWIGRRPAARASGPAARRNEAQEAVSQSEKLARLLAVLFLAKEPLSSRKLSQYANLADGTEARTLVRHLQQEFSQAGRAFGVREVAGGFQLATEPRYARWIRRLQHIEPPPRLSTPALETLAVVAHRQPVPRAEIELVRGVACGEILNQLMSRDLIRVAGRSTELGRPYLYSTTRRFLQAFGLRSLDQLPISESPPGEPSDE